ncbi:MAG: metal-dependent transcriptional regulator [Halobacteriales archaeon]
MNTADQYLRTIYLLERRDGDRAATGDLADALGVSPASANEMVGKLEAEGLVDHEKYAGAALTAVGEARARTVLKTYCILERFLANVLEVEAYREEASTLESVIDETVADRLDTIIDRREECPECFDPEAMHCRYLEAPEAAD